MKRVAKTFLKSIFLTLMPYVSSKNKKRVEIIRRIGIPLSIANFIFQRLIRIDSQYEYSKHYTTRILEASNLHIEEDDLSVLISIAVSGGCYIQAANGIYIGKGTIFAPSVAIVSLRHDVTNLKIAPKDPPISIGRNCWLGAGCVIKEGIVLGNNTVVGAGSVVTKSFPDGHVALGGVPARVIRKLS